METCQVCKKEFDSLQGLVNHILHAKKYDLTKSHLDTPKEYYDKYINKNEGTCKTCGKPTKFHTIGKGYSTYCSSKCSSRDNDLKEQKKKTSLEKYGVDNPSKCEEIKNKIRQTNQVKYVSTSDIIKKEKSSNSQSGSSAISIFLDKLFDENKFKLDCTPKFKKEEYVKSAENRYLFECNTCKKEFLSYVDIGLIPRCSHCYPANINNISQNQIKDFISNYFECVSDYKINPNLNIDIFIPSINVAIKFSGLYWHTEKNGYLKNSHLNDLKLCEANNIRLIHIFEDEWVNKPEIVKSVILNKTNKTPNKIFARKCKIKVISSKESREFLNNNHIQGAVSSPINIGLFYNDQLVSLLNMGKSRFNKNHQYEIVRFSNKTYTSVIGAFSKLFKYFNDNYLKNNETVITYADKRYSNGNLYSKNNFIYVEDSKPNYFYINPDRSRGYARFNRVQFQKHKLEKSLKKFNITLTEWENMQLNGYDRIWDSGQIVYTYTKV